MRWNLLSFDTSHHAKASAAVLLRISIQNLLVGSLARQSNSMAFAHDRREVADADNLLAGRRSNTAKRGHILAGIIDFNPTKTARIAVGFPQRAVFLIKLIQILNQRQHASVNWSFQQVPIQTLSLGPFAPLAELAAHEQQFLAGVCPHVTVQRAQVREL